MVPADLPPSLAVFAQGLALGLGLIVAIGAQNAFVLRQGLRREHVGSVVLLCALADAALITAGVLGLSEALANSPGLARGLALAGAAFLALYGWQALRRARRPGQSLPASALPQAEPVAVAPRGGIDCAGADPARGGLAPDRLSRSAVLAQAAAFTLLNPHVYLDTVLLVGGMGAQQPEGLRVWFVAGASLASLGWFTALGFGGRWLAPLFARPRAWQVLDALIALTMWTLCALLLRHALHGASHPI